MVGWMDDWMHGLVNVCVGCLLVVTWAYGTLIHTRGPLPKGLRALRHAIGPTGLKLTNITNNQYTHSVSHASSHSLVQPPAVHSRTHPFTHPLTHPLIHLPIHALTHSPLHSPTHPSIHSCDCMDGWMSR